MRPRDLVAQARRGYFADALAAAEAGAGEKLADPAWLADIRAEASALAAEVDAIITELRGKLDRGFD